MEIVPGLPNQRADFIDANQRSNSRDQAAKQAASVSVLGIVTVEIVVVPVPVVVPIMQITGGGVVFDTTKSLNPAVRTELLDFEQFPPPAFESRLGWLGPTGRSASSRRHGPYELQSPRLPR
jgi:hypothetical protein